jgi:hypothetical protein
VYSQNALRLKTPRLLPKTNDAELHEHSQLIPADPFLSDFSVANAEHCEGWPSDDLARCHRMATEAA